VSDWGEWNDEEVDGYGIWDMIKDERQSYKEMDGEIVKSMRRKETL